MFNWLLNKLRGNFTIEWPSDEEWSCKRKVWYRTRLTAEKAYIEMRKRGTLDHEVEAYKCRYCGRWHLGGI